MTFGNAFGLALSESSSEWSQARQLRRPDEQAQGYAPADGASSASYVGSQDPGH
jgi:hypothetical protein